MKYKCYKSHYFGAEIWLVAWFLSNIVVMYKMKMINIIKKIYLKELYFTLPEGQREPCYLCSTSIWQKNMFIFYIYIKLKLITLITKGIINLL